MQKLRKDYPSNLIVLRMAKVHPQTNCLVDTDHHADILKKPRILDVRNGLNWAICNAYSIIEIKERVNAKSAVRIFASCANIQTTLVKKVVLKSRKIVYILSEKEC